MKIYFYLAIVVTSLILSNCAHRKIPESKILKRGLDCHLHVNPRGEVKFDANRALLALDSANLSHGCLLSQGYHKPSSKYGEKFKAQKEFTVSRNNWTIEQANKSKRLLGFCSVPINSKWAPGEVKRCINMGANGLKLHPVSEKVSLIDEKNRKNITAILKAAQKIVVLIHINHSNPKEIDRFFEIARTVPETKIIVAHSMAQNISLLEKAPKNIYIEFSGIVMAPIEAGPYFIQHWRKLGIDKVLFGSDWPIFHPSEHRFVFSKYPLTEKEKLQILWENPLQLFGEKVLK